jgi:hypothetical protein
MKPPKYINCGVSYLEPILKQESIDNLNNLLTDYRDEKIVVLCDDIKTTLITLPFYDKKYSDDDLKVLWISMEFPPVELGISPDKLILIGVDKITDEQQFILDDYLIEHYKLDRIIKIGFYKIIETIKETIAKNKVHVVLDPNILLKLKFNSSLLIGLAPIVSSLDLINMKDSDEETFRLIITELKISNKTTINLFNEDSYFLVYRPMIPSDNTDTGWYILRGIPVETKKEILSKINDDQIITLELDDNEEYLVSKTTINKQYELSYHVKHTIYDIVLFPEEKKIMHFELITKYTHQNVEK